MVTFSLNIRVGGETLAGALDGRLGNVGADVRWGFTYGSPTGNGVEEGMPFSIDMKGLRPTRTHAPLDCFAALARTGLLAEGLPLSRRDNTLLTVGFSPMSLS